MKEGRRLTCLGRVSKSKVGDKDNPEPAKPNSSRQLSVVVPHPNK